MISITVYQYKLEHEKQHKLSRAILELELQQMSNLYKKGYAIPSVRHTTWTEKKRVPGK